jgi:ABC-type uncharacterized transport system ATPase component
LTDGRAALDDVDGHHSMRDAQNYGDRTIMLTEGRIALCGHRQHAGATEEMKKFEELRF